MGYADGLLSMVHGLITTLTPRFPESGPPTLVVSGEDRMVKLKDRKPKDGEQKKFVNKTELRNRRDRRSEKRPGPDHPGHRPKLTISSSRKIRTMRLS